MKKVIVGVSCFILVTILTASHASAQGCSDAGVCTIHAIKNNTNGSTGKDDTNNDIVIGFAFGKGERNTSVYTPYLEYTRSITDKTSVTGKVSFSAVNGELANTSGPGDLFCFR